MSEYLSRVAILSQSIKEICERYHVRQMILFGSVLRNDFDQDSDIDILVDFDPELELGYILFYTLQEELSDLFERQIDLMPKSGLKPVFWERIKANFQVIYERQDQ